jgi:hypothetical protein
MKRFYKTGENHLPMLPARLPGSIRFGVTASLLLALGACGSSEDDPLGGGIGLGSGQDEDPVVVDFPIAYVKRTLPLDEEGEALALDARELIDFAGGAELFLRDRASPTSLETNITERLLVQLQEEALDGAEPGEEAAMPRIDIRDLEVSFDGTRLVFALRMPVDPDGDEEDQPTWNIWQYDIPGDTLSRVITSDLTAEQGHDVSPSFLPDGRIIFSSTRQRRSSAVLLDEGKPQFQAIDEDGNEPAFVLHTMTAAGTDIQQVSFNQSHDQDPTVLQSGEVVFSRWDNSGANDGIHLYKIRPDGSGLQLLYGAESHFTGTNGDEIQFLEPREMPDGRLITLVRPFVTTNYGGDLQFVDVENFVENTQPTAENLGVLTGPAQQSATANAVDTEQDPSPGGRYSSVFPLWDGTDRLLVTWSQCRLQRTDPDTGETRIGPCTDAALADPEWTAAPPLYGVWLYDLTTDTQLPVLQPEEGIMYTDVVATQPRPLPQILIPGLAGFGEYDPALADEGVGVIHIRSVYDFDGEATADIAALADPARTTADVRPARFLRLTKAVSQPDEDLFEVPNTAFGPNRGLGMREILGYAPIEPDGSVRVKVPANVAFSLSILNANGRRISARHQTWLTVQEGEIAECNGCHDAASPLSHGRMDAFEPVNQGAQTTSLPFPNTTPAIFADFGETMAEARTRISCALDNCAALTPSVDIVYEDVWTDEDAAGRPRDAGFEMRYADLETPPPTLQICLESWSAACRITINYEEHIHPIWSVPRVILDEVDLTVIQDNTCTSCHSPEDPNGVLQVPAAQLDLGEGPSDQEPDQFKAYRELLFGDTVQELNNGVLIDALFDGGIDPETGLPIFVTQNVAPPASANGANASGRFMAVFAPGGAHEGYLSAAELRLISEWLDVGAQYYNNPFAAPMD